MKLKTQTAFILIGSAVLLYVMLKPVDPPVNKVEQPLRNPDGTLIDLSWKVGG